MQKFLRFAHYYSTDNKMRKILLPVCVVALASSMLFTSCIGSFKLTNKVLSWNHQIGNKFVNELVFVGLWILPVYEISAIADALIINSIEFWSGTNPIEAGTKTVTSDNERYLVAWDNTGYKITNETTGEETRFNFDADTNSWALATPEGDITILTFIDAPMSRCQPSTDRRQSLNCRTTVCLPTKTLSATTTSFLPRNKTLKPVQKKKKVPAFFH